MAKRRKKSASPRRRKTAVRRRRAIARVRPTSRTRTIYINPGKSRRRRSRRSYRRNGSGSMNLVKSTFTSFAAGFVAGGLAAVLDKQFSTKPTIARIAKVVAAFGIAKFGSKHPRAASAAIGALAASEGYSMATRVLGGAPAAHTPDQAVKGLADMSESYPEMGALLNGGMGALLSGDEGMEGLSNATADYANALQGSDYDDAW